VLYVKREAWPEQDVLIDWLQQHGTARELEAMQLQTGEFAEDLQHLLHREKPPVVVPTGTQAAAQYLANQLAG
jgi:hypothetical protein